VEKLHPRAPTGHGSGQGLGPTWDPPKPRPFCVEAPEAGIKTEDALSCAACSPFEPTCTTAESSSTSPRTCPTAPRSIWLPLRTMDSALKSEPSYMLRSIEPSKTDKLG
jgi:hypothetical protein